MPAPQERSLKATVLLDSRRLIAPIDRGIFGGFLEHVGRAVYGGVFDPDSPLVDESGFRRDVISAVRRLGVTAVRYPGGNFASSYNWRDGVGPREARPVRREPAWEQTEPNTFGTDEFLAWCRAAGVEPILTANLGTGSPEDAAEWVRYCTGEATKRRSDEATQGSDKGHSPGPAPSSLRRFVASSAPRLWCLGNEIDGPWQAGHTTAERYAQTALRAARLMREADASIQLVLAGSSGDFLPTYLHWDRAVLEACWDDVDFLGVHRYSHNREGNTAWYLAEGVAVERMIEDFAALLRFVQSSRRSPKRVHLAIDEWNVWYRAKGPQHERGGWRTGAPLLQEGYNMEDALVVGQYLAAFIRRADVVRLACLAQVVNALAPIVTTPAGLLRQTIYHPFALFARHAGGFAAEARVLGATYDAGERGEVPAIDAAATSEGVGGRWSVFLTNRLTSEPVTVTLEWSAGAPGEALEAWQLTGPDPSAANTFAEPDRTTPTAAALASVGDGRAIIALPPLSLTVLSFR